MGPIIAIVVFFIFVIGIIVFAIKYGKKKNKEKNDRYQDLGRRLNLEFVETKHLFVKIPYLSGNWKNQYVEIYEKIVGSGKNQTIYTYIVIHKSPHNYQFKIGKENFFTKVGKKMGFKDIEFDNLELDKKILFKSKDESQFKTLMDYKKLHDLEGVADSIRGTIQNKDGQLTYVMVGAIHKAERMEELEKVLYFMETLVRRD